VRGRVRKSPASLRVRRPSRLYAYDLCQDLADRTRFAMVEAWESEAALAKHLGQPSLQAGLAKLAPMAAGTPTLLRLRPV
jgi:quinol monooxygenase YgiN